MLQLQNNTPFAANMALFPDEEAVDTLYVMVKATFNIGPKWTLADEQLPPVVADEYWTEAGKSSIKYASDVHTGKLTSDIIMLGHACSTQSKEVNELDVSLKVGKVKKTIRVFGDRVWQDGKITAPKSFKSMPLVFEKAFGGFHIVNGQTVAIETRNPVGRGFAGQRTADQMNGVPLPNLEDPENLIRSPEDCPQPACFAASAPHWLPRAHYAGTYDEVWQTQRAPYLPEDFDKRFYNVAHPDLIYPEYLMGGEYVEITNMHPRGTLKFNLPRVHLKSHITVKENIVNPQFNLETLILEPNALRLSLLWRAALQCDKQTLKISDIKITMSK